MGRLHIFNSIRTRLFIVLATLLVATLGVQYYLFRREEMRRAVLIAEQEQALAASTALALESITTPTKEYLWQLDEKRPVSFLKTQEGRVQNILVVNEQGRVDDSLDPQYAPQTLEDGTAKYYKVSDVPLPRLVEAEQVTSNIRQLLSAQPTSSGLLIAGESRAFPIPVRTSDGVNYIIIVLGAAKTPENDSWADVGRPLLPTLSVLLIATLAATVLVWRFTRPIQELSDAARRVAAGDFNFHVPYATRSDEMGALARGFNEMLAGLGRLREVEGRLNQAERSAVVGRLASAIAHEIRNPLNYINLSLDHLRTSLAPSDPEKRAVVERMTTQLKAEVQRINARITEFLSYTRPAKLEMRPVDLRPTLEDALRLVEAQAAEVGAETRLDGEGDVPPVVGDAESLRSLFTNLIINAVQSIDGGAAGGRIIVRLARDGGAGRVRVDVSDTGAGIAAESIPQLFEPYFSTKETGTGLGLAIVKKAVEDHDGTITVESTPGAGTTFTVILPTERMDRGLTDER